MSRELLELRILPPFAIARLGSSLDPMDNYELEIPNPIGARQIVAADTLIIDKETGEASLKRPPFAVRFRDAEYRIRPISPFLEVWARFKNEDHLTPLTIADLAELGLDAKAVKWQVHVANIKAYRRTGDTKDRIESQTGFFSDHTVHQLEGHSKNFFKDKFIPLGSAQYIRPSAEFPEVRLRFTPAAGKVYGPPRADGKPDGNLADEVYDPAKGKWRGYIDPTIELKDVKKEPKKLLAALKTTNPAQVYAGKLVPPASNNQVSYGYLDDECDGIVTVELTVKGKTFSAYARIAAGPPTFAPDSQPVRTVADELEQAMFGPDFHEPVTQQELDEVQNIVRRALETVRLMNTGQMNLPSKQRGVGMARMDYLDVNRALEPIVDPAVADSLAIRSRHERVLLALESGSLAWFARVLRNYDEVGDLSDEGRRKMPALMRSADGRHLALTRRQVSKVRAAAENILNLVREDEQ